MLAMMLAHARTVLFWLYILFFLSGCVRYPQMPRDFLGAIKITVIAKKGRVKKKKERIEALLDMFYTV